MGSSKNSGIGSTRAARRAGNTHAYNSTPRQPGQRGAEFLQSFASPVLAGAVFAALLAAIMSTADGFLNIGTAAVIHDIPNALTGRSVKNELLWARVTTVILAVVDL